MPLPQSLCLDLECIPSGRPAALLMRHSNRFPITDPDLNYLVGLTQEGVRLAEEFGQLVAPHFRPGRVMSSPIQRCIDTAAAIARGAGWPDQVLVHPLLSHDHILPAWTLVEHGDYDGNLPPEVLAVVSMLLDHASDDQVLDVMVTHDTIIGTVANCLLGAPVLGDDWPLFLEGIYFWKDNEGVHALWRGAIQILNIDRTGAGTSK